MELELIAIVLSALATAGITWAYISGIYDKKLSRYTSVIANYDQQNKELRRQIDEVQRSLQIATDNPRVQELEIKLTKLLEQRQQTLSTLSQVRDKVEQSYASHTLGQYLLAELETIVPSPKTIEKKHLQETEDVFRRIRYGIR